MNELFACRELACLPCLLMFVCFFLSHISERLHSECLTMRLVNKRACSVCRVASLVE